MKQLKIGFVLDDSLDRPDGVQQYMLTFGEWLVQDGHEVHYIVGNTKRTDLPYVHSMSRNVHVRFNHNRLSIPLPAKRRAVRGLFDKLSFDILHVQMPYSPSLSGRVILGAPPSTAIVGTFHVAPISKTVSKSGELLRFFERKSLQHFDGIISVSKVAQQFAQDAFKLKSTVLPIGLVLKHPMHLSSLKVYDDRVINILFLGRLVPRKGCRYLIEAIKILRQQDLNGFRVIVAGTGPLEKELKALVNQYQLQDCVDFVGFVSEDAKQGYLAIADIAVFPSTGGESFGIVLIEAMAVARGVVLAGDNPGYCAVMDNRQIQLFVPTDSQALAKKLAYFLQDSAARKQSHVWQQQYISQFDIKKVGPRLLTVYEQALHHRRDMR